MIGVLLLISTKIYSLFWKCQLCLFENLDGLTTLWTFFPEIQYDVVIAEKIMKLIPTLSYVHNYRVIQH